MTAPVGTRTLEQNLDVLRLITDGHLAEMILQLPTNRQEAAAAAAAAAVVRLEAPAHDAIRDASADDLPAVVRRLIAEGATR